MTFAVLIHMDEPISPSFSSGAAQAILPSIVKAPPRICLRWRSDSGLYQRCKMCRTFAFTPWAGSRAQSDPHGLNLVQIGSWFSELTAAYLARRGKSSIDPA